MGFASCNLNHIHARPLVWAHYLGFCCTGDSSRDPSRQVTLPTLTPALWCMIAQSQEALYLFQNIVWSGHATLRSLILGNELHPLLMASCSPFFGREKGICYTEGGFLWLWQNCTLELAKRQYHMGSWLTGLTFTSQKLSQHICFDMAIFYADTFQLCL